MYIYIYLSSSFILVTCRSFDFMQLAGFFFSFNSHITVCLSFCCCLSILYLYLFINTNTNLCIFFSLSLFSRTMFTVPPKMILRQWWQHQRNRLFARCSSTSSTIFALATGTQVRSGVAIIRVSGSLAARSLLSLTNETDLNRFQPNQLYLRNVYHQQTKDLIDQCMIVWFKGTYRFDCVSQSLD
jgi:hypothetical protein